jgi:hypothetical protein
MAGFLERLLGHTDRRLPYDCTVTYQNGDVGVFHFWAKDVREALHLCQHWMPQREQDAVSIQLIRREES